MVWMSICIWLIFLGGKKMDDSRVTAKQQASQENNGFTWFYHFTKEDSGFPTSFLEFSMPFPSKDHYGLEKVKRRILEFLAVQKMRNVPCRRGADFSESKECLQGKHNISVC